MMSNTNVDLFQPPNCRYSRLIGTLRSTTDQLDEAAFFKTKKLFRQNKKLNNL